MRQPPLHLALPAGLAIPDRPATPAWLGWALRLLGGHGIQQDGVHIAASGQLIEPLHRQHRPLAAGLPRLDDLDRHVLVAVGQLPELLGQDIKGDGSLVLGVLMHDQLGELVLIGRRPDRSETRICLTATARLHERDLAKHSEVARGSWLARAAVGPSHRLGS
jgi:hypothetical protein